MRFYHWSILLFSALTLAFSAASTGTIVVSVSGIPSSTGEIGCSLFAAPEGFPLDTSKATIIWQEADPEGLECRFENLAPGNYAIAVSHDRNGNRKVDRNLVGIPKEAWGVSNNARPRMRAPRFEEAQATLAAGETLTLTIEIAR